MDIVSDRAYVTAHVAKSLGFEEKFQVDDSLYQQTGREMHIGQNYGDGIMPAKVIRCATCGAEQFEVGESDYFIGIRCVSCGWEYCIAEG